MKQQIRIIQFFLLILFIFALMTNISHSQDQNYPRGAQYFLGTDDQLLIKVNIWGFVAKPGQYLVPSDTDLISLISFAGGPRDGAKLSNIKLIRAKRNSDEKEKMIDINVKKFIETGNEDIIPRLQPDDTIIISGSTWFHINSFLGFVTKIATLIQIYWWIAFYNQRN
jgi:hypothetical protein